MRYVSFLLIALPIAALSRNAYCDDGFPKTQLDERQEARARAMRRYSQALASGKTEGQGATAQMKRELIDPETQAMSQFMSDHAKRREEDSERSVSTQVSKPKVKDPEWVLDGADVPKEIVFPGRGRGTQKSP